MRGGLWRILSLVITTDAALSSAGSLPLKMTTGCTQPPCNPTHWISRETVRISAHQYPVNILETQVVAVAACVHNILLTIRLITSPGNAKKSRKSQYFPQTSDVDLIYSWSSAGLSRCHLDLSVSWNISTGTNVLPMLIYRHLRKVFPIFISNIVGFIRILKKTKIIQWHHLLSLVCLSRSR